MVVGRGVVVVVEVGGLLLVVKHGEKRNFGTFTV